jgi:hypothetical protein
MTQSTLPKVVDQPPTKTDLIGRALRLAARRTIWEHKRLGQPIVDFDWKERKVVWVQPEDIPEFDPNVDDDK